VTVNGVGWGTTPVTIRHIDAGTKRVRVTLDGFDAVERIVQVGSGVRTVEIALRPPD
jgi:hypothetical protein